MRIAMLSTPFVAVPPPRYGGTELVVADLVEGLIEAGHTVTLFATGDSSSRAEVRALYRRPMWPPDARLELAHAAWALREVLAGEFDLVHAHVPSALAFAPILDMPMVCTVHMPHDPTLQPLYRYARDAQLIAISARQRELSPELRGARVILHGLDLRRHPFGDGSGGYVAFLGRLSRCKGAHTAIDAATRAGLRVRIAGAPHQEDAAYYERELRRRLAQRHVEQVGEVGGEAKLRLLGDACALAFPIEWEEPFGLVMIEAMLTGTPVVALGRGSVPEIVDEGVTGFVCRDVDDLARRLRDIARGGFDRRRCRARARARWSAQRMVAEHLDLYRRLLRRETDDARPAAPHA
jgi:glycosyltransferase involved in cell wall biosynthesis